MYMPMIGRHGRLMSNLNDSWMSCRASHRGTSPSNIALLPQFNVPPGVTDFSMENRPPHLPERNSPSRACLLTVAAILCIVGSYSTLNAAAEPVMMHTTNIAHGVSNAVGRAISKANKEAERNAMKHYEARERFLNQRRLSNAHDAVEKDDTVERVETLPEAKKYPSVLLLRMAALLKTDTPGYSIDFAAVDQFFPLWREQKNSLNKDEVLKDLILAVSQLAHASAIDQHIDKTIDNSI